MGVNCRGRSNTEGEAVSGFHGSSFPPLQCSKRKTRTVEEEVEREENGGLECLTVTIEGAGGGTTEASRQVRLLIHHLWQLPQLAS